MPIIIVFAIGECGSNSIKTTVRAIPRSAMRDEVLIRTVSAVELCVEKMRLVKASGEDDN